MTPDQLLQTVSAVLLRNPPPGLSRAYINGFLKRNRKGLLTVIRRQFDRMCRLDGLIADYEQKIGYVFPMLQPSPQIAVFGKDVGSSAITLLACKARCHPMDPVKARLYAIHSRRADEKTWRIYPGEEWHPSEDAAITAFATVHAHEARWLVDGQDENWTGVRDAPYVLAEPRAVQAAKEQLEVLETERTRQERERVRQLENYDRQRAEQTAQKISPLTEADVPVVANPVPPTHLTASPEPSLVAETDAPAEVKSTAPESAATLWGGTRGALLPDETIQKGMRVVTFRGEHGVVEKVDVTVWRVAGMRFGGDGLAPTDERTERSYSFLVRLDSGRADHQGHLYSELSRPTAVVPDLDITDAHVLKSPPEAWREVYSAYRAIAYYQDKSANARKPLVKAQYLEQSREAKVKFDRLFRRFHEWRSQYPRAIIEDFDPLLYRILTLEAGIRTDGWESEMRWLKAAPKDWRTRYSAGDAVIRPIHEQGGRIIEKRDRISSIDGTDAVMEGDGARLPLYQLRSAPGEALETPAYTEPRYLYQLAMDMLAPATNYRGESSKAYPERGAVARAVKAYLADHGIDVRTRVQTGSMMNGIDLQPPGERWSQEDVDRMNELLPNLGADRNEATFHPSAEEGTPGDPYTDYYGTPTGILFEPEQIPGFAPYLARGLKDAGQALNRSGEAWLALTTASQARVAPSFPSGTRNGATGEQRQEAAGGCFETQFTLPPFGEIRVVCGAQGRRDVWHNVYISGRRHGFNGGRWAKGMVPPAEVLRAIRERGITAFSQDERLEEPRDDMHLDPVIWEVVQNGGLRADLISEIGDELRPRARAIPGFLRVDGLSWLELARLHYNEPGIIVVDELPDDHWEHSDRSYETTNGYAELVHYGLEHSFPEVRDEHYEEEETVERLCGCRHNEANPPQRAGTVERLCACRAP